MLTTWAWVFPFWNFIENQESLMSRNNFKVTIAIILVGHLTHDMFWMISQILIFKLCLFAFVCMLVVIGYALFSLSVVTSPLLVMVYLKKLFGFSYFQMGTVCLIVLICWFCLFELPRYYRDWTIHRTIVRESNHDS